MYQHGATLNVSCLRSFHIEMFYLALLSVPLYVPLSSILSLSLSLSPVTPKKKKKKLTSTHRYAMEQDCYDHRANCTMTLECPAKTVVVGVEFASYGTPGRVR